MDQDFESKDYREYESLFRKDFHFPFLITLPMRKALGEIASFYGISMSDVIRTCIAHAAPQIYPKWPEVYARKLREEMAQVLEEVKEQ